MQRKQKAATPVQKSGFLGRLRQDMRGNALIFMAAMIIPLMAFTAAAVDMGRFYSVKTRLQQACDAGALAGRKLMMQSSGNTLDPDTVAKAKSFFDSNFTKGWFAAENVAFTPKRVGNDQVQATASAKVPTTLMTMFGEAEQTVTVTCQARYDVPDSDVMFVLDTTGSMAEILPGSSSSKIDGLRSAVMDFYDTMKASADPNTHVRYGFVTYTSAVNVGGLLPKQMLTDKWYYQTREWESEVIKTGTAATSTIYGNQTQAQCDAYQSRTPVTDYNSSGTAKVVTSKLNGNQCTVTTKYVQPQWRYGRLPVDVSSYIDTLQSQLAIPDPSKRRAGSMALWQGCVEERETVASSSFDQQNLPADLDPDLLPVKSVDGNGLPTSSDTRWRPMYTEIIYDRGLNASGSVDTNPDNAPSYSPKYGDSSFYPNLPNNSDRTHCGKPASRLAEMTRDEVSNFVNAADFKAMGTTFHDTGMIWGTRLISPKGLFKADTTAWPGHDEPSRYIVFMTDGQMNADPTVYGLYGFEKLDQRVTGGDLGNSNIYHNSRFLAECTAAKNRNITVFVIGFGQTLTSSLKSCASPGQAFYASDNDGLKKAFKQIAGHIAMLRLSK